MNFTRLVGRLPGKLFAAAGVCVGLLALSLSASADTFSVQYFEVPVGSPDFYVGGGPGGVFSDYVTNTLGADGLPVFNTASAHPAPADLNGSNEIMWWTPNATTGVTATGTGTLNVTPAGVNMFPPNSTGTNDGNFEETAILTGTFNLATETNVTFQVGADDDAFVYVDGSLVDSLGGIHADTLANANTVDLGIGNHTLQIFYADQEEVAASLSFYDNGVPVTSSTPEPGSLALLGTGILALGGMVRRRVSR